MKETTENENQEMEQDFFIMENLIGISVTLFVTLGFMWVMGKCFESDLKDLEKTNPKYRKWLKDNYDI